MKEAKPKIKRGDQEVVREMIRGSAADRKFICSQEFMYFCIYYFSEFFTHGVADFHFEAYEALKFKRHKYYIMEWFRSGGKTSCIKMFITWCICLQKKNYIIYVCYDKDTAKQHLYDVALWLQTNDLLIADFGQLFYEKAGEDKFSKKKAISEFVTANKIKVEAASTQEPLRGRVYGKHRPDAVFYDDFENEKTKMSYAITSGIMKQMDETLTGLGINGNIVYLCNYISDLGSVERLHDAASKDKAYFHHQVNVVEGCDDVDRLETGRIAWPEKYVFTDAEAEARNVLIEKKERHVVSIESLRRTYKSQRRGLFEQEMLNIPIVKGDKVFDPVVVRRMLAQCKDPRVIVGDWLLWDEEYHPHHRYAIGADVAEGVGADSSAAVVIDFSTHPSATVVGTYANNKIAPDIFAHELRNIGNRFGGCLVANEINNQGYATLLTLRDIYNNIYEQEERGDYIAADKEPTRYGWLTTVKSKPEIIFELRTAVETGLLVIFDENLVNELLSYNQGALKEIRAKEGMTKHFDLLMALAIGWRMRNHAVARGVSQMKADDDRCVGEERFDVV